MSNFDWEADYNYLMNQVSKIKDLNLPCYGAIDNSGYDCDEDSLCDACKVRDILNGL